MPETFATMKTDVASVIGGSGITAQETKAGNAIVEALRDMDSRDYDWEFKLRDLPQVTLIADEPEYAVIDLGPADRVKKIHTVRLLGDKRTLVYARQRLYDRLVRDQESSGIPIGYRDVRGPLRVVISCTSSGTAIATTATHGFRDKLVVPGMLVQSATITETDIQVATITSDAAAVLSSAPGTDIIAAEDVTFSAMLRIRLFPTPNGAASGPMLIRAYAKIQDSYAAGDYIDVPDRYLTAVRLRAKYYLLLEIDPEDPRLPHFAQQSEALILSAMRDDAGNPDEDIAFVPFNEWASGAMGPDPINDLEDFSL